MHRAYIKINRKDGVLVYRATGHAGGAPVGENVICASASMLAMTLAEKIAAAFSAGWIENSVTVSVEDPENTEISCIAVDDEAFGELARDYFFVATGYRLLALHNPDAVDILVDIRT